MSSLYYFLFCLVVVDAFTTKAWLHSNDTHAQLKFTDSVGLHATYSVMVHSTHTTTQVVSRINAVVAVYDVPKFDLQLTSRVTVDIGHHGNGVVITVQGRRAYFSSNLYMMRGEGKVLYFVPACLRSCVPNVIEIPPGVMYVEYAIIATLSIVILVMIIVAICCCCRGGGTLPGINL